MAQDIDQLIPEGAKQDLEDVSKLWDDIVTKVTGYVKEVQKISISPDASRTLISMDESLAKIAESTRRYEKALQDMATAQQRAAENARQLAKADAEGEKSSGAAMDNVKELAGYIDDLREKKAKLRGESQSSVSMWKVLGSSLGSVMGIANLAIATLGFLSDKIFGMSENAKKAKPDIENLKRSLLDMYDAIVRGEKQMQARYDTGEEDIKRNISLMQARGASSVSLLKEENRLRDLQVKNLTKERELYTDIVKAISILQEEVKYEHQGPGSNILTEFTNKGTINGKAYLLSKQQRDEILKEIRANPQALKISLDPIFKGAVQTPPQNKLEEIAHTFSDKASGISEQIKDIENERKIAKVIYLKGVQESANKEVAIEKEKNIELGSLYKKQMDDVVAEEMKNPSMHAAGILTQKRSILNELEKIYEQSNRLAQDEINALTEKYGKGLVSEEKYQKGINEIKARYAQQSNAQAVAFLQQEVDTAKLSADEKISTEKKLAELRLKGEELTNEKIVENRKKLNEKLKELSQELKKTTIAVYKGMVQSNINGIEQEMKAAEEKKTADIAAAESAAITEEEKQARIKGINAGYENEKKQLEQKKKDEQRKAAEFEKRLAIAEAFVQGAKAVVAVLPNVPLSVTVAAISAAQIAAMMATPIPQFYKGTDDAPRGLAWVGERGTEAIVSPDGSIALTPDKPTLTYLQGGEQIIPNHLLDALSLPVLNNHTKTKPADNISPAFDRHTRIVQQTLQGQNLILRQIRDKKQVMLPDNNWKPYINQQVFK